MNNNYKLQTNNSNISLSKISSEKGIEHYEMKWKGENTFVDSALVTIDLDSSFNCMWKPHLAPKDNMTIGDYVFNAPIMYVASEQKELYLIPDVSFINEKRNVPYVMDYVLQEDKMYFGLANYKKTRHVYHELTYEKFEVKEGEILGRFYLYETDYSGERDLSTANDLLWKLYGKENMELFEQSSFNEKIENLDVYQKHAYDWAFDNWESIVWNEFTLDNQKVGGCTAIVKGTQSPGEGQENNWREDQSIWNQAWFSQVRSAVGIIMSKSEQHHEKAKRMIDFALATPKNKGLFPSVLVADKNGNWNNGQWKHSNRKPRSLDNVAHLLDMSWTCWWLLKWTEVSQYKKTDIICYVSDYVETLLSYQNDNGSFPAWIDLETFTKVEELDNSAETSMHAMLLFKYLEYESKNVIEESAVRALEFVINNILPEGKWEDFETYWSCAIEWELKRPGEKDRRSNMYNQNNFSIYWTVEALKKAYMITKNKEYLEVGIKVLNELSLYQAIWTPEFLGNPVLGGFGVMLSDDEWNDARQSLFAVTYYDYYLLTKKEEYLYRAYWAMNASFYMMYCPENLDVSKTYEKMFPFFSEKDFGFEMENLFHGEHTLEFYGEFSIFDWGCGSASTSLEEIKRKMVRNNV